MNRRKFVQHICIGYLSVLAISELLQACKTTKFSAGKIRDSDLLVPMSDFIDKSGNELLFRKHIIVQNDLLRFPICIYRFSNTDYLALWLQCTHQGNELRVFGDMLHCPAHGSEFDNRGRVQNGPADKPLRKFPVEIEGEFLKISLKK